jgi:hypothetical protein
MRRKECGALNQRAETLRCDARRKIPESDYTDGPEGLKYFDLQTGGGAEAKLGQRVTIVRRGGGGA